MPELPEVESARLLAESHLAGKTIIQVRTIPDPIMFEGVSAQQFGLVLRRRRIIALERRGKHLWIKLDRRPWPTLHFGMTGFFEFYRDPNDAPRFLKFEMLLNDGLRFAMGDPRRLGRIRLLDDPEHLPPISDLGPDPLLNPPTAAELRKILSRRKAPIKAVLLDQSVFAGVGNWIADEVLYQSRVSPHRLACDLTETEILRLRKSLLRIIARAVRVRADYTRFPKTWLFHTRWGKNPAATCATGQKIIHQTIAGRTTAWVPAVQK